MITLNPITLKQWQRFKSIKRGYWSAMIFAVLLLLTVFAELFVSNRALLVSYEGELYFPSYGAIIPGRELGLDYDYETNYRDLKNRLSRQ